MPISRVLYPGCTGKTVIYLAPALLLESSVLADLHQVSVFRTILLPISSVGFYITSPKRAIPHEGGPTLFILASVTMPRFRLSIYDDWRYCFCGTVSSRCSL